MRKKLRNGSFFRRSLLCQKITSRNLQRIKRPPGGKHRVSLRIQKFVCDFLREFVFPLAEEQKYGLLLAVVHVLGKSLHETWQKTKRPLVGRDPIRWKCPGRNVESRNWIKLLKTRFPITTESETTPPRPLQWGHDPHDVEIRPKKKRATYGDGRWTLAGAGRAFNGPLSGASGPEATAPAATAPAAPSADSERILAGATPVLGDLISMRIGITCCALATSAPNFWNRPIKKKTKVP